jgi:hypothetical protein
MEAEMVDEVRQSIIEKVASTSPSPATTIKSEERRPQEPTPEQDAEPGNDQPQDAEADVDMNTSTDMTQP